MTLTAQLWSAIGGEAVLLDRLAEVPKTTGALPSSFQVERFGAAAAGAVGLALAELTGADEIQVHAAASAQAIRSEQALRIGGAAPESVWDPLSRTFRARDGWIRLHGNYRHHREAIEAVLGTQDPAAVAEEIRRSGASELETRIQAEGGAAAAAHTLEQWDEHPHGRIVRDRALIDITAKGDVAERPWRPSPFRLPGSPPLVGLRVLELTRVIAGPVAGRTLGWFGADVLRIESSDHDELRVITVDFGPGKRSAQLDLRSRRGREQFEELLAGTDVFLHGLRPGALQGLGLDAGVRAALAPGIVDASLSAYGPGGPWSGRRGFDSLLQLSTGIGLAEAQAAGSREEGPRPLPCQLLDHATGLLMAAGVIRAVAGRIADGRRRVVVGSLARTAAQLVDAGRGAFDGASPVPAGPGSLTLEGSFGATQHAPPAVSVAGVAAGWREGAHEVGADAPSWEH